MYFGMRIGIALFITFALLANVSMSADDVERFPRAY